MCVGNDSGGHCGGPLAAYGFGPSWAASPLRHCVVDLDPKRDKFGDLGCRMISATLRNFESVVRFVHDLYIKRECDSPLT